MIRFDSILPSKQLLEKPRTPVEWQAFVRSTVADSMRIKSERHAAFQKMGLYKQFVDEVVPLSAFANQYSWAQDVRIALVLGKQRYDAVY